MAKKYFWLKLKDDFFRDKRIKKLRRVAGGDTYTVIYLKMQLLSLKNEGVLFFEGVEDSFAEEIALEIDEDTDNVKFTIMFLTSNGLIEEVEENEFSLVQTIASIGSESASTPRVRKLREKQKEQKALQCNTQVTMCNTEKEKEKEKELENKDIKDNVTIVPSASKVKYENEIKIVVDHYNQSMGTRKGYTEKTLVKDLTKIFKEGYTTDNVKDVLNYKIHEWINNKEMKKHLVPGTLFRFSNFEKYLDQVMLANQPSNAYGQKKYQQPTPQVTSIKQPSSFTPTEPDENGFNGCNFEISWIGKRNIDHNLIIHYYKEHIKNTGALLKSGGREITVQELIEEIEWDRKVKVSV